MWNTNLDMYQLHILMSSEDKVMQVYVHCLHLIGCLKVRPWRFCSGVQDASFLVIATEMLALATLSAFVTAFVVIC